MEERPLQIEFETEFLERFEMMRSELGLDSIRRISVLKDGRR